ncbi:MAG TPA: hypothetical protein VGU61_14960 [Noviherbaspirillum sp.]|nr:hypothetical protein [Noviherbaspirillum sp.]
MRRNIENATLHFIDLLLEINLRCTVLPAAKYQLAFSAPVGLIRTRICTLLPQIALTDFAAAVFVLKSPRLRKIDSPPFYVTGLVKTHFTKRITSLMSVKIRNAL